MSKHGRDEEEEEMEGGSVVKRFRGLTPEAEELIHMLEDAEEERNVAEEEVLSDVMKSLEEEISSCCCSKNGAVVEEAETRSFDVEESGDQMTYLLTASDDELGIPPSPSVMESPLYEPPSYSEEFSESSGFRNGGLAEGLWHFEDYNSSWMPPVVSPEYVYDEYQERDFGGCGGLFELSEGEQPSISWRQETTCAI